MNALLAIQRELRAPKGQFNRFGGFKYRSCEDILEAVKPILEKHDAMLLISDDIVPVGEWVFVKATATLKIGNEQYGVSAFARLDKEKKGMDAAQLTGSASSYARKYALNGLLLIDDAGDPDAQAPQATQMPPALPPVTAAPVTVPRGVPLPPPPPPMTTRK